MGFGLLWYYWIVTILYPGEIGVVFNQTPARIVTLLATLIASALCILAKRRMEKSLLSLPLYTISVFLVSGGTAVSYFGGTIFDLPDVVFAFSSFSFGLGNGVCLFMYFELLAPMKLRGMRFGLISSVVLGLVLYLVCMLILQISPLAFGAVEASFAVISIPLFIVLKRNRECVAGRKEALVGKAPLKISLARVSSIMIVFGMLVGMSARSLGGDQTLVLNILMPAFSIIVLVAFGFSLHKSSKVADVLQCGKLCVVVGALGLMLQLFSLEYSMLSVLVFFVTYVLFFVAMFIFYASIVHYQSELDAATLFSMALIADSFGLAVGFALHAYIVVIDAGVATLVLFFAASFFIIAGAFFFNKHSLFPVSEVPSGSSYDVKGEYVRCVQLAEEHELTPRQKEVFLMLARGRRVKSIAEELVLSPGTVRGHVNQIYGKLGIHSNDELILLIRDIPIKSVDQL